MESTEKAKLHNETRKKIEELLTVTDEKLGREYSLEIISVLLKDYDLKFLGELVKADYEPSIDNQYLQENCCYDEGNEEAGHIPLKSIFSFVEEILNKADDERCLKFDNYYVSRETEEEMEEEGHDDSVEWYKEDKEIELNNLVGFTVED